MPSTNLTYNRDEFTQSNLSFDPDREIDKKVRWNTQTLNLQLDNTNHKLVSLELTLPSRSSLVSGNNKIYNYALFVTSGNNSVISTLDTEGLTFTELSGFMDKMGRLFDPMSNESGMYREYYDYEGPTGYEQGVFSTRKIRILINVNPDGEPKTEQLKIYFAIAYKGDVDQYGHIPLSNFNVGADWNCNFNPIYSYTVGVHPWSPYDAVVSRAETTTKLYSFTPIGNWQTGDGDGVSSRVFADSMLNNPALCYYYGYGNNVYRVGDKWSRSYGKSWYVKVKKRRFGKPKTTTGSRPIRESYDSVTETSDTCLTPIVGNVGEIKEILLSNGLPQPQKYRYYMGYHASNKRSSNDDFFVDFSYEKKRNYPITGVQHVLTKIAGAHVNGYYRDWASAVLGTLGVLFAGYAIYKIKLFKWVWDGIERTARVTQEFARPIPWINSVTGKVEGWIQGLLPPKTIKKGFNIQFIPKFLKEFFDKKIFVKFGGITIGKFISIVLLAISIIKLFLALLKRYTYYYEEACNKYLHHFTDSPYLEIGDFLYRDKGMTVLNNGWYCDGANYYYQNSSGIVSKQVSSTLAYMQDNPFTQEFIYSTNPKSNPFIQDWTDLHLLCYIAGKPEPYCGGGNLYQSQERSATISSDCCDLQQGVSQTVSIQAGEVVSCVSLNDANSIADQMLSASINALTSSINLMGQSIDDTLVDQYDVEFTHEIKIEDNPTYTTLYRDNRSGSLAVGDPLYTDINGCHRALSGYYATSSGAYYREFYKVADGKIVSIDYLSSSGSSTTTSGKTVSYSNLEYTSDWMFKGFSKNFNHVVGIYGDSDFDTRQLYISASTPLVAGYYISASLDSGSLLDFRIYPNSSSTGVVNTGSVLEAESGWYLTLVDWIDDDNIFEYEDTLVLFTSSVRNPNDGFGLNLTCGYSVSQLTQSYYHNGSNSLPTYGDRIYTSTGSRSLIPRKATDGFYKITGTDYITVSNGIVTDIDTCSTLLTCGTSAITHSGGPGIYDFVFNPTGKGYLTASFDAGTTPDRIQIISGSTVVADSLFVGDGLGNTSAKQGYVNDILNTTELPYYVYNGSSFNTESLSTVTNYTMDSSISETGSVLRPSGSNGSLPVQSGVVGGYPNNNASASAGDIKLQVYRASIGFDPYTVRIHSVTTSSSWTLNNVSCFSDNNGPAGNDVDPVLLRYNTSTGTSACTSSQQTFYISGSFTGTLHGIWTDSQGTTRANSGSYSNGTVYRNYVSLDGVNWFISNTASCSGGSGNTVLSSSLLAVGFTDNGACGNTSYQRYWYTGGSAWYNSSTLYQSTSSNGQGNTVAIDAYYSDGITVNEWSGTSWGSAGICGMSP